MFDFEEPLLADEWLAKGAAALLTFWDEKESCFVRATGPALVGGESHSPGLTSRTGATSSNRAFLATTELLFFLAEEGRFASSSERSTVSGSEADRWQSIGDDLFSVWTKMAVGYYSRPLFELRKHSDNGPNDFTDGHVILARSVLQSPFATSHLSHALDETSIAKFVELIDDAEDSVESKKGARIAEHGRTHPLLTLSSVRAIEAARHVTGRPGDRSRVSDTVETILRVGARDDLLRQLGLHAVGDAEFDPAALLGDTALLHRFAGMSGRKLVEKGVELLAETQGFDGSWKTAALTGENKVVWIPSLEIAVALSNLVLADLTDGSDRLARLAQPILERSLGFLESGYSEAQKRDGRQQAGWTNDQARQPDVVESWSTALALQLLLRLRRISRRLSQHEILNKYRTEYRPRTRREWLRWPDLSGPIPLVRFGEQEAERAKTELRRVSDPSGKASLDRAIWTDVVEPTLNDTFNRPNRVTSFVLYGPPGTRKSSMVGAIAAALDWPLVTLAPPDFLTSGIVGLEARAEEIFRDLLGLRRVVVFFDECEELFRRRTVVNSPEHRVQSDFITSGMLPRLQDLRQGRWVVFSIATNTELDELDPAVVRFGRIDGQQRVGHPDVPAQIRYLTNAHGLSGTRLETVTNVLRDYDAYLESDIQPLPRQALALERRQASEKYATTGDIQEYFKKADTVRAREAELPLVTFSVLDELSRRLGEVEDDDASARMADLVREIAASKGRPKQWTEIYL